MAKQNTPQTLQEAIIYFADYENCRQFMANVRWLDGVVRCPYCNSDKVTYLEKAKVYRCYGDHPKQKFSLKVGTVFEDSPIPLEKWLPALWLLSTCKNGISSYEIHRSLGVTQKSAWFMLQRIRLAMQSKSFAKAGGEGEEVEVDETYIGGSTKNMHKDRIARIEQARGTTTRPHHTSKGRYSNKVGVFGIYDREQRKVRASVIPQMKRKVLQDKILKEVDQASKVYSDQSTVYHGLSEKFVHETVNHLQHYVDGHPHERTGKFLVAAKAHAWWDVCRRRTFPS
jgi:transposase-like protein